MSAFISLSCPSCGARLTITDDKERFLCDYCSNEHLMDRALRTSSDESWDMIALQKSEEIRETHSELVLDRLNQEASDLEADLDEIGMPISIGEVIASAICGILIRLIIASIMFFAAWAGGNFEYVEGIPLVFMRIIFAVGGIGILAGTFEEIKKGAEGIAQCRRDTQRRVRTLDLLNSTLVEIDKRQAFVLNEHASETSRELASEHAIRRIKSEIAGIQNKIDGLIKPESPASILLSTLFGVTVVALISRSLISWASSQSLPQFIETQLGALFPLPAPFYWILGFSGIIFAIMPLKTIEAGIVKLNAHSFYIDELSRLKDRLAPKAVELEKQQTTLNNLIE